MSKQLLGAVFTLNCLWVYGAGLQAEHIVTHIDSEFKKVAVGQWTEDEVGRSRFDIDDWTEIIDPIEGLVWRANSKRGRYSKKSVTVPRRPMGTPLIHLSHAFRDPNVYETSRTNLGTLVIDGVQCEGTRLTIEINAKGRNENLELEAWTTKEYIFPFNMVYKVRTTEGEQITELRDVITLTDTQLEGYFKPARHWKESRFLVTRTNIAWTGFWPFVKPGSKETGTLLPWPKGRQEDRIQTR